MVFVGGAYVGDVSRKGHPCPNCGAEFQVFRYDGWNLGCARTATDGVNKLTSDEADAQPFL